MNTLIFTDIQHSLLADACAHQYIGMTLIMNELLFSLRENTHRDISTLGVIFKTYAIRGVVSGWIICEISKTDSNTMYCGFSKCEFGKTRFIYKLWLTLITHGYISGFFQYVTLRGLSHETSVYGLDGKFVWAKNEMYCTALCWLVIKQSNRHMSKFL